MYSIPFWRGSVFLHSAQSKARCINKVSVMNLSDHKFIVFAEDHFNPLGIIRSLGEEGIRPVVVMYSQPSILVKYCKYIDKIHYVDCLEDGLQLLLSEYGNEKSKPFLYSASDKVESFFDLHYDDLIGHFYFYNAGGAGRITKMMQKDEIVKMAELCGLQTPKSEIVKRGVLPITLKYPILTKANTSTIANWKSNVFICKNKDELLVAFEKIACEEVLLQEYVEKVDELNIEGFCINGGESVFMPLQNRFYRTTEQSFGNFLYIDKLLPPMIEEKVRQLFALTHYSGVFEVEFLIGADGCYYFLEINFRNSAWAYAYTKCGVNLFLEYAKSILTNRLPCFNEKKIKNLPFSAMDELTDFKWSVMSGKVNIFQWIKELFTADCHFYYNKKDQKPLYYYLFNRLLLALHIR